MSAFFRRLFLLLFLFSGENAKMSRQTKGNLFCSSFKFVFTPGAITLLKNHRTKIELSMRKKELFIEEKKNRPSKKKELSIEDSVYESSQNSSLNVNSISLTLHQNAYLFTAAQRSCGQTTVNSLSNVYGLVYDGYRNSCGQTSMNRSNTIRIKVRILYAAFSSSTSSS